MATPFNLTEEDLQSSAAQNDESIPNEVMDKIPILRRRAAAAANSTASQSARDPIAVIVVGMAGSGKTTLMTQLQRSLNFKACDGGEGGGDAVNVSIFLRVSRFVGMLWKSIICCTKN